MNSLKGLKKKRDELDRAISKAESAQHLADIEAALKKAYVKVACADCEGTGEVSHGGADIESDPPFSDTCPACHGEGFLYARKWSGKNDRHSMDHNQVFPV